MHADSTDTDIAFAGVRRLAAALADGSLSSRALLEIYASRIEALNPELNAVVAMDLENARRRADEADEARRRGESWGPLHGLPLTIKDTYEVLGMPCVAGTPEYREHRPSRNAIAVQKLLDAGAIAFAKTNVPYKAMDIQTYNPVHGVSRNPWDPTRTTGGSSGGAASALAAGFTPLELGSDIGGSIRIPAHFCGVYGHKPTHDIVSLRGHIPGEPGHLAEPDLAVAGPMARSAEDLMSMLDFIAGPSPRLSRGWELRLPPPRRDTLRDFRILVWIDDPDFPLDPRLTEAYQELARALADAGARTDFGSPLGMGLGEIYRAYALQMGAVLNTTLTRSERMKRGLVSPAGALTAPFLRGLSKWVDLPRQIDGFVEGMTMSHAAWRNAVEDALHLRERFLAVFESYDVILAPPTLTTAFAHDHGLFASRRVRIDGRERHYTDLFAWISPATLMGLPATSAPIGLTPEGLPVNVQIVGAPFEDKTTIRFAELLETVAGGFRRSPRTR